jgi:hypothetical protein
MSIEDTFFGCGETPIWIPSTFDHAGLSKCISCTVRLTAKLAGPGNVTTRDDGLLVNENPTTTLTINGIQHSLVETILSFPGGHRYSERQTPCVAELFLYFQNTREFTEHVCLAIPLDIGEGESNAYFSTLDAIRNDRPTVASVLPTGSKYIMYKGADLRGRTGKDSRPRNLCDPVKKVITYYLSLTPSLILAKDYSRLQKRAGTVAGPPKPASEVVQSRLLRLGTLIDTIKIDTVTKENGSGISTNAMKCYKLDPTRDIVKDKVYVGGVDRPGDRTLAEELEQATTQFSDTTTYTSDASIKPGDIEKTLGIVLGVIVGIVICSLIAYMLWKHVFTNYLSVQELYNIPVSASKISQSLPSIPSISNIFPSK